MGGSIRKCLLLRFAGTRARRWPAFAAGAGPARGSGGVPVVELPARPGRAELDPLLAEHDPRRLVVAGTDADLAAVLVRLLRTERLHVEVAYLPARRTPATAAWGLPTGARAAAAALDAPAGPVPLIRDDSGGVLVGRGEFAGVARGVLLRRDCWCCAGPRPGWSSRRGRAGSRCAPAAGPGRPTGVPGRCPPTAATGHGSATGRAVQVGCAPATVVLDGVPHPRPVRRWSWYRHTADWLLVGG